MYNQGQRERILSKELLVTLTLYYTRFIINFLLGIHCLHRNCVMLWVNILHQFDWQLDGSLSLRILPD
jgi:hypothetical protein